MKEKIIRIFECDCRREDYVFKTKAIRRPVCPDHHELQTSKIRTCSVCGGTEEVSNYVSQTIFHCSKCRYGEKLKSTAKGNKKRGRPSTGRGVTHTDPTLSPLDKFMMVVEKKFKAPPAPVMSDELRRVCNV